MRYPKYLFPVALLAAAICITQCSDDAASPSATGRLKLYMTDAPGNVDKVLITFSEIHAHINNDWVAVRGNPVTVDLLEWNNGKSVLIGDAELGPGKYTQLRLMIEKAELILDGQTNTLTIPSSAQTGLKLVHAFEIVAGSTYELVIDFDVEQSIVLTGPKDDPNSYKLKPTLRVVEKAVTGSISGIITNPGSASIARAEDGQAVIVTSSTVDPVSGAFTLAYLPAGTYQVRIEDPVHGSASFDNVVVIAGRMTDIGSLTLQ